MRRRLLRSTFFLSYMTSPFRIVSTGGPTAAERLAALPPVRKYSDLKDLAVDLKSGMYENIVVLSGAGTSCAAGIPDFRSPGGMYDTLKPEVLTATKEEKFRMRQDPTFVVEKQAFFRNQFPYHEVRRPFILGTQEKKWKPTLFHHFMARLDKENFLRKVVTQNIDGLEYQTSINPGKVCPCHGSLAQAACENCKAPMDFDEFCALVKKNIKDIYGADATAPKKSTNMKCPHCRLATLKPTTVLFGSQLPETFFEVLKNDLPEADLVVVVGTSLLVSPANQIVNLCDNVPRIVIDHQIPAGAAALGMDFTNQRDSFFQGDCDEVIAKLMNHLHWLQDVPDTELSQLSQHIKHQETIRLLQSQSLS